MVGLFGQLAVGIVVVDGGEAVVGRLVDGLFDEVVVAVVVGGL